MNPETTGSALERREPGRVEVSRKPGSGATWTCRPRVDVFDTPDALVLIADLPGAKPEEIDVTLERGLLTLQARVGPRRPKGGQPLRREYGIGGFHRRFEIDDRIDQNGIRADHENGTLTIHLPKASAARRRRIPVTG